MDKEKVYEKDMHAVLVSFLSFQSIAHKDDDEMKFKCPLLSSRDQTEKDAHIYLNPLPPPAHFCPHCC